MKMRRAFPSIPIAALWLLAAPAALALPVEVTFSGVISGVEGTVPGGIAVAMPFSGSFSYDPAADENPSFFLIELTGPNVVLQLDIGAASYEIATDGEPFRSWYYAYAVDEEGEIVDPDDLGAIPKIHWFAAGEVRSTNGDERYFFTLGTGGQLYPSTLPAFLVADPVQLPNPSLAAAEFLQDGFIFIGNASELPIPLLPFPSPCGSGDTGFCANAHIKDTAAVPEPSPAALLLVGLAALGASKRSTRRP
jgi:hypothetical protein